MGSWQTGNTPCLVMAAVTVFYFRRDVTTDAAPSHGQAEGGSMREGFMMDTRRYTKTALDVHGKLHIRLHQTQDSNGSWVGYIEDPRRTSDDDIGALYYVVAVILIYGLSIVMMIASHIRKNKQDNQLRAYLKEMANLRKSDRREKVLSKMNDLANRKKTQDALEAKQKVLEKLKGAGESEAGTEATQELTKKDTNEDNADSVFLPPDYCISPLQPRRPELSVDKQGDVSSLRNSVGSKSSLRFNSTSSYNSNGPSAATSPALSDCRHSAADRVRSPRSPSFHDYRRWKRADNRTLSALDYRTVRIQERLSPSALEQRSVHSQPNNRSPSLSEFRPSTLCGRERSSTIHETRPSRWGRASTLSPNNARFYRNVDIKPPVKTGDLKLGLPASFYVVDEDAVL
ncbi:unnamed protein product [Lymnaea stagnalis]|uniref:Uncharacterized protein n=1 Tax=Lymnaea stagnalis TaxID=6523 RepID=A0AAV2HJS0_LYMST